MQERNTRLHILRAFPEQIESASFPKSRSDWRESIFVSGKMDARRSPPRAPTRGGHDAGVLIERDQKLL
jgi:hypothetical protein